MIEHWRGEIERYFGLDNARVKFKVPVHVKLFSKGNFGLLSGIGLFRNYRTSMVSNALIFGRKMVENRRMQNIPLN